MPPRYPLASVDHALRVLELLRSQPAMRLSDVASEVGIANSTAHRLLAALVHRGFVEQNADTRRYLPGRVLLEIGRGAFMLSEVRERARPVLEALAKELDETIHLGVREGRSVEYVDAIESSRAVRVAARAGRRLDAHCSSIGKVLLAAMDDDAVRRLYGTTTLPTRTTNSIDSTESLVTELAHVRRRGFAVNNGESEDDVVAVAVALCDADGTTTAGVGCAAPRHRMTVDDAENIAARMTEIVGATRLDGDTRRA